MLEINFKMVVSSKMLGAGTSFNAAERNGTHPIGQTQVAAILKILFKVESFMRPFGHNHLKDIVTNIL